MKTFISIVIALLIFIGLSIWNITYLNNTSKELSDEAQTLHNYILSETWDDTADQVMTVRKLWAKHKKTWLLLVDHEDIDQIDMVLYQVNEMARLEDKEQALFATAELRFLVQDIADKETLSLANIF